MSERKRGAVRSKWDMHHGGGGRSPARDLGMISNFKKKLRENKGLAGFDILRGNVIEFAEEVLSE